MDPGKKRDSARPSLCSARLLARSGSVVPPSTFPRSRSIVKHGPPNGNRSNQQADNLSSDCCSFFRTDQNEHAISGKWLFSFFRLQLFFFYVTTPPNSGSGAATEPVTTTTGHEVVQHFTAKYGTPVTIRSFFYRPDVSTIFPGSLCILCHSLHFAGSLIQHPRPDAASPTHNASQARGAVTPLPF